jgi:hypothetical protein
MRVICRGLLILLTLAPLVLAETAAAQSLSGGVIVGVNSSTVSNFGNVGPTTLRRETGLLAGFYVEASLARFASLQPEVVYLQKGIRLDGPVLAGAPSSASASITERFDSIEVPILVQDIKDGVTGTDAGVLVGGGFSIGRVGIDGRFDAGLRNLIPPTDRRAGDRERTHRSVSVAARLRF